MTKREFELGVAGYKKYRAMFTTSASETAKVVKKDEYFFRTGKLEQLVTPAFKIFCDEGNRIYQEIDKNEANKR